VEGKRGKTYPYVRLAQAKEVSSGRGRKKGKKLGFLLPSSHSVSQGGEREGRKGTLPLFLKGKGGGGKGGGEKGRTGFL